MKNSTEISQEDADLMDKYNIKRETKDVFLADGYKYDKLNDAVRYAKFALENKASSGDS